MDLPVSQHLPIHYLSSVFRNTTNSYKFYWFLSILEHVQETDRAHISLNNLIARMIARIWYPANYFRLSFGKQDRLRKLAFLIKAESSLQDYDDVTIVLKKVMEILQCSPNADLGQNLRSLARYVPYRFVRPWYRNELKGIKEAKIDRKLRLLSETAENSNGELCIYKISHNNIVMLEIPQPWFEYLKSHFKILKEFCLFNLLAYLQKNNPNVPNLLNKLFIPSKRKLHNARKFWEVVFDTRGQLHCIYSETGLSQKNFSIDHFIPWRLVTHDLLWNLVPIPQFINSSKSDRIPSLELYFDKFAQVQQSAFRIVFQKGRKKLLEDYAVLFQNELEAIYKLSEKEFGKTLRSSITPLVQIAENMGYTTNWVYQP